MNSSSFYIVTLDTQVSNWYYNWEPTYRSFQGSKFAFLAVSAERYSNFWVNNVVHSNMLLLLCNMSDIASYIVSWSSCWHTTVFFMACPFLLHVTSLMTWFCHTNYTNHSINICWLPLFKCLLWIHRISEIHRMLLSQTHRPCRQTWTWRQVLNHWPQASRY